MKLSDKILQINQKGIENLDSQGVILPTTSTTTDIITAILDIVGGGSEYKSITYIGDNTIQLVDEDDIVHRIVYEITENKISSISYDDELLLIKYNENTGKLESIGDTDINLGEFIFDIVSGGGITYTNIVYNEDGTFTLTDKDGVEHTMSCTYEDDKLIGVIYDEKAVELTYDGDMLVKVGKTEVDMANVKTSGGQALDHTVTFTVDGEPYQIVSVKDGTAVSEPQYLIKDGYNFIGWKDSDEIIVTFPVTPTEDTIISATYSEHPYYDLVDSVYKKAGVNYSDYPFMLIHINDSESTTDYGYVYVALCSQPSSKRNTRYLELKGNYYTGQGRLNLPTDPPTLRDLLFFVLSDINFINGNVNSALDIAYKTMYCNQQPESVPAVTNLNIFDDGH